MVDFIVFSSLFRVLFVLPVGLARLDVFPFSLRRLECSCHPSQSTKGDFSICWAPGRRQSSAFRSALLFFSLFGVFVDLLSGFSLRRVFSFFSGGLEFFSHPFQSNNVTSGGFRYQEDVLSRLSLVHFLFFWTDVVWIGVIPEISSFPRGTTHPTSSRDNVARSRSLEHRPSVPAGESSVRVGRQHYSLHRQGFRHRSLFWETFDQSEMLSLDILRTQLWSLDLDFNSRGPNPNFQRDFTHTSESRSSRAFLRRAHNVCR